MGVRSKKHTQMPGSESQALRFMAHAEELAQDVADWLAVATAWQQNFSDPDKAQRCMSRAQYHAEDKRSYKWEQTLTDWIAIARAWERVFDDRDGAQHWMAKTEAFAEESFYIHDWIQMAKIWKNRFRDRDKGIQCLMKAEEIASGSSDWIQMAEIWKGSFRNRNKGIECLRKAEDTADDSLKWTYIAIMSMEDFRDSGNGIRCLEEAEVRAENSRDWILIAKVWKQNFQNSDRGIQCLKKAEDLAKNANVWSAIGATWGSIFEDSNNCDRCLKVAYGDVVQFHADDTDVDMTRAYFADDEARQQAAIGSLGFLDESSREHLSLIGTWGDECVSERRPGCYARYYSFTLAQAAEVIIEVTSDEDTYLYLISGGSADGEVLDEDKSERRRSVFGYVSQNLSHIMHWLAAGTYTVEATTYNAGNSGAFSLTIHIGRFNGSTLYI